MPRRPGFACLDTAQWHTYRLERRPGGCRVLVDGRQVLASDDAGLRHRLVRFGAGGELETRWRSARAPVYNPADYSIDWRWRASRSDSPEERDVVCCTVARTASGSASTVTWCRARVTAV